MVIQSTFYHTLSLMIQKIVIIILRYLVIHTEVVSPIFVFSLRPTRTIDKTLSPKIVFFFYDF